MAKKLDAKAQSQYASLFEREKFNVDDSQVSEFTAGSKTMTLPSGNRIEIVVNAEPAISKAHGLHLALTISGWLCENDSANEVCMARLDPKESLDACASKSPIAHILATHPRFLSKCIEMIPGFGDALAASAAEAEAREIAKSAPASRARAPRASPRM